MNHLQSCNVRNSKHCPPPLPETQRSFYQRCHVPNNYILHSDSSSFPASYPKVLNVDVPGQHTLNIYSQQGSVLANCGPCHDGLCLKRARLYWQAVSVPFHQLRALPQKGTAILASRLGENFVKFDNFRTLQAPLSTTPVLGRN